MVLAEVLYVLAIVAEKQPAFIVLLTVVTVTVAVAFPVHGAVAATV